MERLKWCRQTLRCYCLGIRNHTNRFCTLWMNRTTARFASSKSTGPGTWNYAKELVVSLKLLKSVLWFLILIDHDTKVNSILQILPSFRISAKALPIRPIIIFEHFLQQAFTQAHMLSRCCLKLERTLLI